MERKTICLYHRTDLDGHCSGAICAKAKPGIHLHGINYGDPIPWDLIDGNDIIVVDWAFSPVETLIEVLSRVNSMIWLDHHKTSLEMQKKLSDILGSARTLQTPHCSYDHLTSVLDTSRSGCEITWKYFYPDNPIPVAVWLLGRYDVWDHRDDRVLPFQYRMRMEETDPSKCWYDHRIRNIWNQLLVSSDDEDTEVCSQTPHAVRYCIHEGSLLTRYEYSRNAKIAQHMAYEIWWQDMRWLVINNYGAGSKLFESIWDPMKHHGMLTFAWTGTQWLVSMYSDRPGVDVSTIASAHGGGGHAGAAGFHCEELPFDIHQQPT